jgi:signal transduction histidine kinase
MDGQTDIAFIRTRPAVTNALARPATLAALGGFWLLSFALAWMVGREVVRPLVNFSRRLPNILTDQQTQLPETSRTDEVGQLARAIISTRDQLTGERQKRERGERLALLGKVAAGLAHEIKNPLASIRLHSQLAATAEQTSEAAESLKHIQNETQVIEGLVNQWLYLARPQPPKKTPVEIGGVLRDLAAALKPQAGHAGVAISLSQDESITVMADCQRLAQAFRNIVLNAIQHMPSGGEVKIKASSVGVSANIRITDQGGGFSREALQKGAELFFSGREGGMGLGLNVAQEIIHAHGGRLELENDSTRGACVQITLPLAHAKS